MSQKSADPALSIQANGVQRYVPSMSALRVACRTPWGTQCDLVVLRGHVIVPRELAHARALWWVRDEKHPGLAVAPLSVLERQTGAEIGLSPYCVPVERWNEAALGQLEQSERQVAGFVAGQSGLDGLKLAVAVAQLNGDVLPRVPLAENCDLAVQIGVGRAEAIAAAPRPASPPRSRS
jgi:hypothetical protein